MAARLVRLARAVLGAAAAAGAAAALLHLLEMLRLHVIPTTYPEIVCQVFWMSLEAPLLGALVGLVGTLTFGMAWHALAQRFNWRSLSAYVVVGATIAYLLRLEMEVQEVRGTADSVAELTGTPNTMSLFDLIWYAAANSPLPVACAIVGAAAASGAWLIRRPDRDAGATRSTSTL